MFVVEGVLLRGVLQYYSRYSKGGSESLRNQGHTYVIFGISD